MVIGSVRSLRATRFIARAPRVALLATCLVLSAAGVRTMFESRATTPTSSAARAAVSRDIEAEALAEAFARAYLTWDGQRTDEPLRAFGADVEEPSVPGGVRQRVRWTTVTSVEPSGKDTLVTVAAHTSLGVYHLAVPMARERRGLHAITGPPALVGAPPVGRPTRVRQDPEVDDPALVAMVRRALKNYLGAERSNLLADLTDDSIVVLPDQSARLRSVDAIAWAVPRLRVAAVVHVRTATGVEMTLRYELAVVRRAGRWLVRAIHTNPTQERHP